MAALQTADWIYLMASAVFVVLGLFRGLSGIFAFVSALVAAGVLSVSLWGRLCATFDVLWSRALAAVVLAVVTFGIVRCIVKLVMRKMISQPSDSIIGVAVSVLLAGVLLCTASTLPLVREYSALATYVYPHVGGSSRIL